MGTIEWRDAPIRAVVAVGMYGSRILWTTGHGGLEGWCDEENGDADYAGIGEAPITKSTGRPAPGLWLWCSACELPEPKAGTAEYSAWVDCSFHAPRWSRPTDAQAAAIAVGDWEAL